MGAAFLYLSHLAQWNRSKIIPISEEGWIWKTPPAICTGTISMPLRKSTLWSFWVAPLGLTSLPHLPPRQTHPTTQFCTFISRRSALRARRITKEDKSSYQQRLGLLYNWRFTYLAPQFDLDFWRLSPQKKAQNSNQKQGGHLSSRYMKMLGFLRVFI